MALSTSGSCSIWRPSPAWDVRAVLRLRSTGHRGSLSTASWRQESARWFQRVPALQPALLERPVSWNISKPLVWEHQSQSRNQAGHKQSQLHSNCLIKAIFGIETHRWEGKQKADKLAIKKRCGRIAEPYQPFQRWVRGHDKSVFVLLLSRCAWSGDKTLVRVHFAGETWSYTLTRFAN